MQRFLKGILLRPVLNLLSWILRRNGNSLIIGGPLGWTWQATLDTTHHGSLAGPANAHRHSDLSSIGIDDHHARDHAARHQLSGGDQISLDASQIGTGRFGMPRMPAGTSGHVLTAQGAGVDPVYAAVSGVPAGIVVNWTRPIAQIPSGWVICDGNNGTQNLLGRFLQSVASAATNPGSAGGSTSKTTAGHQHAGGNTGSTALTVDQIPSHNHNVGMYGATTGWPNPGVGAGDYNFHSNVATASTGGGQGHTHSVPASDTKTDTINDIRPLYFEVAFIMKT